jgi:hypothetical protein
MVHSSALEAIASGENCQVRDLLVGGRETPLDSGYVLEPCRIGRDPRRKLGISHYLRGRHSQRRRCHSAAHQQYRERGL